MRADGGFSCARLFNYDDKEKTSVTVQDLVDAAVAGKWVKTILNRLVGVIGSCGSKCALAARLLHTFRYDGSGLDFQLVKNVLREKLFHFTMAWNWLGNACFGILIPIVPAAMPDQHASFFFQLADEVDSLHSTTS